MSKDIAFVGRGEEADMLGRWYDERRSQLVVLYGRRRVGKTALLTHFCRDKRALFFTGRKGESRAQIFERLLGELADFFTNPLIAKVRVRDWREIFDIIDAERGGGRTTIVLDEFQWMCGKNLTLISALQEHWDRAWKDDGNLFLVLCGSIVSFMEKNVLSQKSPLFGRRTQSFELKPLPAAEARLFFPKKSLSEQAEIVMTFGGIPSYLEIIDRRESVAQNINRLALTRNGYFVDEIDFVLREQIKNPRRYDQVLRRLAAASMTREDLARALGISNSGALHLYLKTLSDLHLITPSAPITSGEGSKATKYALSDEFLRFYFTFIASNRERIAMNVDDWLYDRIVAPQWESFCGYSFELLCRKNMKVIADCLGIADVFKRAGSYWHAKTKSKEGVQIDLVIERTDGITHLIECRWSSGKIGSSIIEEIVRKKRLYPNPLRHTLKTGLITPLGVTDQVEKSGAIDDVVTLKDLLGRA